MAKEPKEMDRHVGARIRSRRMMLAMSQEQLSRAIGLTFQQVQKYEKGANRVGASRLAQLAEALNVPIAWFFEGEGAPRQQGDGSENMIDKFVATSEGVALVRAFVQVKDAHTRRAVVELVERIAGRSD